MVAVGEHSQDNFSTKWLGRVGWDGLLDVAIKWLPVFFGLEVIFIDLWISRVQN